MAVKVMLAPAIAQRSASGPDVRPHAEEKPKRRRSSVYDADGNEVFITLLCLKCHQMRPLAQFGLRRMADGAIRNQPWCRTCRAGARADNPRRRRRTDPEAPVADPADASTGDSTGTASIVDAGSLAAQVVAALHGGRR